MWSLDCPFQTQSQKYRPFIQQMSHFVFLSSFCFHPKGNNLIIPKVWKGIHRNSSKTGVDAVWWSLWTGVVFCPGIAPGTPLLNPRAVMGFWGKADLLHAVFSLYLVWWYRCRAMWSFGCQWWECSPCSHITPMKRTNTNLGKLMKKLWFCFTERWKEQKWMTSSTFCVHSRTGYLQNVYLQI